MRTQCGRLVRNVFGRQGAEGVIVSDDLANYLHFVARQRAERSVAIIYFSPTALREPRQEPLSRWRSVG